MLDNLYCETLPIILTGSLSAAAVTMAEHTVAAPPISALIASIEGDGLSEIPPLPGNRGSSEVNSEVNFMKSVSLSTCLEFGLRIKGNALSH